MTERERAVDNLITKARRAAGVYAVLPPECRKPHEQDLKVAVDRFLEADAHDAAPKPLKWGCRVVKWDEDYLYPYAIDSADGKYSLGGNGWYEIVNRRGCLNFESESEALAALNACTKPPPGYVEQMSTTVKTGEVDNDGLNTSDGSVAPIEQDAGKVCKAEYRTVTDLDEIRAVLDRLPVGAKVRIDADYPGEPFRNQEASVYQSAGSGRYAEWRHGALYQASIALTSLTYRLSDDPLATPAAESGLTMEEALRVAWTGHPCPHARKSQPDTDAFAKANKDIPLDQRVNELDVWASRMSETVAAVKLRAAQHEMWVADQIKTHEDQIEDLASRVAEVERQVIHESRCRIELDGSVESMHIRFTESIDALCRDVDALKGTGPCACKSTTPAPDALPFGCVARQKADDKWQIENAAGTHWWSGASNKWANYCIASGWAETRAEALADFHATYGGKVPPPDHKPASEGSSATIESRVTHFDSEPTTPTGNEYEVEMCPHDIRKNRVVHDGLFMLVQNGRIRWTSDAWTPLDRADAETFASVLRNAQ